MNIQNLVYLWMKDSKSEKEYNFGGPYRFRNDQDQIIVKRNKNYIKDYLIKSI